MFVNTLTNILFNYDSLSACQEFLDTFDHFWSDSRIRPSWDFRSGVVTISRWYDNNALLVQVCDNDVDDVLVNFITELDTAADSNIYDVSNIVIGYRNWAGKGGDNEGEENNNGEFHLF